MPLQVIGAGLGRTGTTSLKAALEILLGGCCYHMDEAFGHPEHVATWRAALRGDSEGLKDVMSSYSASVDWPAGACWKELRVLYPDAIVLLSTRDTADAWWKSADATILRKMREPDRIDDPVAITSGMIREMMAIRFSSFWNHEAAAKQAYEDWNASVRATCPPDKLVEWKPGQGWEPLCAALSLPIPSKPFPHKNGRKEFEADCGWA